MKINNYFNSSSKIAGLILLVFSGYLVAVLNNPEDGYKFALLGVVLIGGKMVGATYSQVKNSNEQKNV